MDGTLASPVAHHSAEARPELVPYRADIDGLRAVAIIAVIIFHVFPSYIPGGYVGVDIFFVISGFLISGIVLRALQLNHFSLRGFYARRVRRIFPALVLTLATTWTAGWLLLLPDEYQHLGRYITAGAGFLTNWNLYRQDQWYFALLNNPLLHLWSLSIEEQFYLLWPLFLFMAWRLPKSRLLLMMFVTVLSFCSNVMTARSDPTACFYLPWNRLWELSAGGVLASFQLGPAPITPKMSHTVLVKNVCAMLGAALIVGSALLFDRRLVFPGWWALAPCGGTLLLISAGPGSVINSWVLSRQPMIYIGSVSYPLYLWHWPLLSFARILFGQRLPLLGEMALMLIAFGLAVVTYECIERPIRHFKQRAVTVLALSASILTCGIFGLLMLTQIVPARSQAADIGRFIAAATEDWLPPHYAAPGTQLDRRGDWAVISSGLVTTGNRTRQVVFLGDSNMEQYYLRIDRLLTEHPENSRGAVFAVGGGCAPAVMEMLRYTIANAYLTPCRTMLRRGIEYSRSPSADTVVIAALWIWYLTELTENGRRSTDEVLSQLRQTVTDLVARHKRVFIVLNIPTGEAFDPRQMIQRGLLSPTFTISSRVPTREAVEKLVRPADAEIRKMAESAGATVIDPVEFLCDAVTCPAVSTDGEPMYRDGRHLRPSYVRDHVSFLDRVILDAER